MHGLVSRCQEKPTLVNKSLLLLNNGSTIKKYIETLSKDIHNKDSSV